MPNGFGSGNGTGSNPIALSSLTYTLQWEPVSATGWDASPTLHGTSNGYCSWPSGGNTPTTGVQHVTLPNDRQYNFTYDGANGLLSSITYPTGATVTYTWGLNPTSQTLVVADSL